MTIREQIIVDVTDEYRVELRQEKKRTSYSTQQARELALELIEAAEKVDLAIVEDMEARGLRLSNAAIRDADGTVIL